MTNVIKREEMINRKKEFVQNELFQAMQKARPEIESLHYKYEMREDGSHREIVLVKYETYLEDFDRYISVDVTADSLLAIAQDVIKAVI